MAAAVREDSPKAADTAAEARARAAHDEQQLLAKLIGWREQELQRQAVNRREQAIDENFYDGLQWRAEDARVLAQRGQAAVVYNEVKPTCDWMIGTERRSRMEHRVVPTQDGPEAQQDAQVKSKVLKYIDEQNRAGFTRSAAFKDAIRAGVGWIELGIRGDPEDDPIYMRTESWRNMLYDSLGLELDLSDALYVIRRKTVDLDVALAYFPDKEDALRLASQGAQHRVGVDWWFGERLDQLDPTGHEQQPASYTLFDSQAWLYNSRERVELFECWYRAPVSQGKAGGTGSASSYDRVKMQVHCAIYCEHAILWNGPSPYAHNKFPFIPVWCYRRAIDNAPYGVIRNIRSPQESLNKRMSKAQFVLSTNQTVLEKGAIASDVMDEDEIREEVSAPDGFIVLADGGLSKFRTHRENDVAQGHLQLAERDKATIREVGGVTSENLGRDTNLTAGIALRAKAEQGTLTTTEVFDHYRFARQIEGEQKLSLAEQFYTDETLIRVTGERSIHEFETINRRQADGTVLNDITARKARFMIDEQEYRASMRQAMFEQMFDLLGKVASVNPQFAVSVLDLVLEQSDVPGKDAIVARIRSINGQPSPDDVEAMEAAKQAQAAQAQSAEQMQQLQRAEVEAKIAHLRAQGEKLGADKFARTTEAMYAALQAAQVVAATPAVAPIADEIAAGAGYVDLGGADPNIPQPAAPADGMPQPGAPVDAAALGAMPPQDAAVPDALPPGAGIGQRAGIETPAADAVLRMQRGGVVPGGGSGDTVPALLEPGEVVMSRPAADAIGREQLDAANWAAQMGPAAAAPAAPAMQPAEASPAPASAPADPAAGALARQIAEGNAALMQGLAAIVQGLGQLGEHLTAERELVRDENNRPIGMRVKRAADSDTRID